MNTSHGTRSAVFTENNSAFNSSSSESEGDIESSISDSENEEDGSSSMFEYELDSQYEEEKKDYDYDYNKEEFMNPIVVKGPDGTISIGTESKDRNTKEALCWNCQAHLIYRLGSTQ